MKTVKFEGKDLPVENVYVQVNYDSFQDHPAINDEGFPPIFQMYSRHMFQNNVDQVYDQLSKIEWRDLRSKQKESLTELLEQKGFDPLDLKESIANSFTSIIEFNDLEGAKSFLDILNISSKCYKYAGQSQSDWSKALIVLTDDFYETSGCDRNHANKILESCNQELLNYTNGDIFWYEIIYKEKVSIKSQYFEEEQEVEYIRTLNNCGGFMGTDPMKNGMSDNIPQELWDKLITAMQNV